MRRFALQAADDDVRAFDLRCPNEFFERGGAGGIDQRHALHGQNQHTRARAGAVQHFFERGDGTEEEGAAEREDLDAGRQGFAVDRRLVRRGDLVDVLLDQRDMHLRLHHFGHAMHEEEGGGDQADPDRDRQIDQDGEREGEQQHDPVAARPRQDAAEGFELRHVPAHHQQHRAKRRHRNE